MPDKYLTDLCWLGLKLCLTEAPREDIETALAIAFEGVCFGNFATVGEFIAALRTIRDIEESRIVLAATAYIVIATDVSREKLAAIFRPLIPHLREFVEFDEALKQIRDSGDALEIPPELLHPTEDLDKILERVKNELVDNEPPNPGLAGDIFDQVIDDGKRP